jgi:hypothetical protein
MDLAGLLHPAMALTSGQVSKLVSLARWLNGSQNLPGPVGEMKISRLCWETDFEPPVDQPVI